MDRGVVFESSPSRLRKAKKLLHLVLQPRELQLFAPMLLQKNYVFLHQLICDPLKFGSHIRMHVRMNLNHRMDCTHTIIRLVAGITLTMSHGYKVTKADDPYVKMADVTVASTKDRTQDCSETELGE